MKGQKFRAYIIGYWKIKILVKLYKNTQKLLGIDSDDQNQEIQLSKIFEIFGFKMWFLKSSKKFPYFVVPIFEKM